MADPTSAAPADLTKQLQAMADQQGNILCMQNNQPVMLPVSALMTAIQNSGGVSPDLLAKPDSLNMLGQVQSFADLRQLVPAKDGMRVSLRGWNPGTRFGGGEFIATKNPTAQMADDGGMVASSTRGWYWTRVCEDQNNLDVTHFGAIPDGQTDSLPAFLAMYNWTQKNLPELGVRYPSGTFFLSQ